MRENGQHEIWFDADELTRRLEALVAGTVRVRERVVEVQNLTPAKTDKDGLEAGADVINVQVDYELRYWSEKLQVSPDRLREIVQKVGPIREKVEAELNAA